MCFLCFITKTSLSNSNGGDRDWPQSITRTRIISYSSFLDEPEVWYSLTPLLQGHFWDEIKSKKNLKMAGLKEWGHRVNQQQHEIFADFQPHQH